MKKPDTQTIKRIRPILILLLLFSGALIFIIPQCGKENGKITASGTIEIKEIDLLSRVSSRVTSLPVEEGNFISNETIVVELDDRLVRAQRASAEAIYLNAEENYRRSQSLYNSGSIPKQQFEQARASFNKAQADLEQAQLMAEETRIVAPWDGILLELHVEVGELVPAFTPLATFGDNRKIKTRIFISTKELGLIKIGQEAELSVDSHPKRIFKGRVTWISEKAEFTPKTIQTKDERVKQVFAVEITAENPDGILKPGMPADVSIHAGKK